MQGLCFGTFGSVYAIYNKEMVPTEYSAVGVAIAEVFFAFGKVVPPLLAIKLGPPGHPDSVFMMKVIIGFPLFFLFLNLCGFFLIFTERTPKFSMSKGKPEEARKALKKIYKKHVIPKKIEELRVDLEERSADISFSDVFTIYKKPFFIVLLGIFMFNTSGTYAL